VLPIEPVLVKYCTLAVRCYYVPDHNIPCSIKCPCISMSLDSLHALFVMFLVHYVPKYMLIFGHDFLLFYATCLECPWVFMIFVHSLPGHNIPVDTMSLVCLAVCTFYLGFFELHNSWIVLVFNLT
jgi:hypothetical protein